MIIVDNKELRIPKGEEILGTTFDNNAVERIFYIPAQEVDISECTFTVECTLPSGTVVTITPETEEEDGNVTLTALITSSVLAQKGVVHMVVKASDTGISWASFKGAFFVE